MSPPLLLPNNFALAVDRPQSRDDRPEQLSASISAAMSRRHAGLLQLYAEAYAVPLDTALFLYRRDPKPASKLVLSSLGGLETSSPVAAIAAAARDACEAQDWSLLGVLAYRFDLKQSATSGTTWPELATGTSALKDDSGESSQGDDAETELSVQVRAAFHRVFDFERGTIPADGYVRAALKYFSALPEYFIPPPPPNLESRDSAAFTDWTTWALFSQKNSLAWQSVTGAWDALTAIGRPRLTAVMDHLRQPVEAKLPRLRRLKNPFAGPAGTMALEPRRRLFAALRPSTDSPTNA
ncbi:MAG: hypothetical protein AABP62_27395 [Planctomycetota bacterium]